MRPKPDDAEYRRILQQFRLAAATSAIVIAGGAVFYHVTERFSWLNAVYFCVVTLATVGYGDITPKTNAGKLFTIFYILVGIGILGTFFNLAVRRASLRRQAKNKSAKR